MLLDMKEDAHNEPELDTWKPLRTVSAPLLKELHVKSCGTAVAAAALSGPHRKQNDGSAGADRRAQDQRVYVDLRLKELAAFERRARGLPK
jgi:hypothetical protein